MRSKDSQSGSTKISIALVSFLFLGLLFAGLGFIFRTVLQPYQPGNTAKVTIEITKGQSPVSISRTLEEAQIIRDRSIFYYYGKLNGSWGRVKAGEYEFSPSMSPGRILSILESGISVARPFLVREGQNLYEIAAAVEARGFGPKSKLIALARDPSFIASTGLIPAPRSLEGYLFPDTYHFPRKTSQEEILKTMVKRFMNAWGEKEARRALELKMSRDQVITLASIVEKETGAPEERAIISGVFHNRLTKRMRLQSDPTSIYGIWERYNGNLRRSDLMDANPYNTYVIPALPIGPISNPGSEAIQATLYPESHSFLYFVSRNDGTHVFSSTYEEHRKAVATFQLDPKAREGKSWRDLRNRTATPSASPNQP